MTQAQQTLTIPSSAQTSEVARRTSPFQLTRGTPFSIWLCLGVIAVFLLCGLLADLLAPHDPTAQNLRARLQPPVFAGGTSDHILGTDALGRDVLSRLIYGARVSLLVGIAGMTIGLLVGGTLGLISGFKRGFVDDGLMFLVDVKLALPFLVIALTGVALLGRSLPVIVLLAGISGLGAYMRLARGMALGAREQPYILAARSAGAGGGRLVGRHILPNVAAPLVVLATFNLTEVIFLESSLSFLGVGVKPPTPSWGSMLDEGRNYLHTAWWIGVFPGLAIVLITMAISLSGDWLRDVLDPAMKGTRGTKKVGDQ
jgi:peptide/nickel transport system permease protein